MKYKKLTLVFLVIIFLIVFSTFSSASFTVNHNGENVFLPDLPIDTSNVYMHYVVCYNRFGYHLVYYESNDFSRFVINSRALITLDSDGNPVTDGSVKLVTYNDDTKSWGSVQDWGDLTPSPDVVFNCNENIYTEEGELFFPQPPLSLGEIVETSQMEKVLQQIVTILPLILVVVVSFLGLRKALQMLLTLLHQA